MFDTKEAALSHQLIKITQQFLTEIDRARAAQQVTLDANLQRELAIDSLGRVELFHRIESEFSVSLADEVMLKAESLRDLMEALQQQPHTSVNNSNPEVEAFQNSLVVYDAAQAQTLVEVLYQRGSKEPNRVHILLQQDNDQKVEITYGELLQKAKEAAAALQEEGIRMGDTVAIMLPTCHEFFTTFFGILLIGAIPVPIYPPFRVDRIEEYALRAASILKNAQVRLLITFDKAERLSDLLNVFIPSLKAVNTVDILFGHKKRFRSPNIQGSHPALIQYTSGSTSTPKGVLLRHQNLLANIRAIGVAMQIQTQDMGVSWLPLYHDMGLIGSWLNCFYHAVPILIMSPMQFLARPERWLWAIHYHKGTLSGAPNFAYELCVSRIKDSDLTGLDLSSWRMALNGAEAVRPKTLARFVERFKAYGFNETSVYPVYGLAETCVALTFPPLGRGTKVDTIQRDVFENQQVAQPIESLDAKTNNRLAFVCCGKAIENHHVRIVNEKGEELCERHIGLLEFKGPSTMAGYYQAHQDNAYYTEDDWLSTGDLAYQVDNEIYLTGRRKDLIIKAGRNLYPDEIEDIASQVMGVRKGCVIAFGVTHPKWETERLVIVAESYEKKAATKKKISANINDKVSRVLDIVPDEIVLVSPRTIPKTSSGKLQRSRCKQLYESKNLNKKYLPPIMQMGKIAVRALGLKIVTLTSLLFKGAYTLYCTVLVVMALLGLYVFSWILSSLQLDKLCTHTARALLFLGGCRIDVRNAQNLKNIKERVVYVANHASYIDGLVLKAVLPTKVKFVAKKELQKAPLLGRILKKLNYIMVDRFELSASINDVKEISKVLIQNESVMIFPEGTFTAARGIRPFKMGAFKIAADTNSAVCAIALKGTREIMADGRWLLCPNQIIVTVSIIDNSQGGEWSTVNDLQARAKEMIVKGSGEQALEL